MSNKNVTLMNNKIVSYKEIEAKNKEDIKCVCHKCRLVFTERPFLCICNSNVFLEDIK